MYTTKPQWAYSRSLTGIRAAVAPVQISAE
jgi:hypothetical protein